MCSLPGPARLFWWLPSSAADLVLRLGRVDGGGRACAVLRLLGEVPLEAVCRRGVCGLLLCLLGLPPLLVVPTLLVVLPRPREFLALSPCQSLSMLAAGWV